MTERPPTLIVRALPYALARVCQLEGARFGCAKYLTDGADTSAPSDWQRNLPRAAASFWQLYRRHCRL